MSIDKLIADCVKRGTSYSERGKSVSIDKQGDELVWLFHTDNPVARLSLGIAKSCDVAFVYMKRLERPVLVFCELKGRNVNEAADQIQSTLIAVRRIIRENLKRDFPQNGDIRAVIVRTGSAPHNQAAIQERFLRQTGVKLQFARQRANLRTYVA